MDRQQFQALFGVSKPLIGMIHLQALPATPKHRYSLDRILEMALQEAVLYREAGVDAIMVENMHDVPYLNNKVGPEVVAAMTMLAYELKRQSQLPCGIQVLAAANKAALAVALAAGLDFVRVEGFVFGHLADEGYVDAQAGELLRYRKSIGAEHVALFTDIKKKHSAHALTGDMSLVATAKAAEFFLSDGLVVTGASTGEAASVEALSELYASSALPVLVGSGLCSSNLEPYFSIADGFIVGSDFKKEGYWGNALCPERVQRFVERLRALRAKA